ncbi:MAG TPA: FtsW/RodA/SpoVE family cell cycle protein [Clostridiaceae bacterium]|nr:FtsW/RodA/SpoVE family cell cycle protein [Clostridiaceae bacterium]
MTFTSYMHLARYGLFAVIAIPSIILFYRALRVLLADLRGATRPVSGFFLLSSDPLDPQLVAPLPLFHTTHIGSSRASDIRVKGRGIRKHHLTIYYHNRVWLVRPERQAMVWLNGHQVVESAMLRQGDKIGIGRHILNFVIYDAEVKQDEVDEVSHRSELHRSKWSAMAVIMTLLLQLGSLIVLFFGMRGTDTEDVAHFFVVVLASVYLLMHLLSLIMRRFLPRVDPILFQATVMLTTVGLIIQARLLGLSRVFPSHIENYTMEAWHRSLKNALLGQIGALGVALVALITLVVLAQRTNVLERLAPICFVLTPILYLVTLMFGKGRETHGAGLWILLPGGLTFQLTEFAKITWIVTLAWFFRIRPKGRQLVVFAFWGALNAGLIVLLPDLGSIMVLFPVTIVVFTVMTSEYLLSLSVLGVACVGGVLIYQAIPYVNRRIFGWISLWDRIGDDNRQIVYGLQAVSRGGLFGRGLGNGSPGSIPLANSDMIFAIVCEELGIIVGIMLILLYMTIWLRGVSSIIGARDGFTSAMILGLASAILIESIVVIGGTTGLIPLTGVTLPFIARGGSSLLAKWLMIALLLGIMARSSTLQIDRSAQVLSHDDASDLATFSLRRER